MLFEELQLDIGDGTELEFLNTDRTRTPAWLIRLACAAHAASASLAEFRNLCGWFGIERRRATIRHWYQAYADHYDQALLLTLSGWLLARNNSTRKRTEGVALRCH